MNFIEILNNKIEYIIGKFTNMKMLLGGDFNFTLNDSIDIWPSQHYAYLTKMQL